MMDEIRCLLEEMADAGIRLWVEDGKLKFRAPSGAMTVERANLIKKNRDAVIAALNEPRSLSSYRHTASLSAWQERSLSLRRSGMPRVHGD